MGLFLASAILGGSLSSLSLQAEDWSLERVGSLEHPGLPEVSGVTRASSPGLFWVHNDSNHPARLFAIDRTGAVRMPAYLAARQGEVPWPGLELLGAHNVDWEDLTSDGDTLFVADLGNNGNARRDLGIYVLPEPNPLETAAARPLTFLPVRYPEQVAFPGDRWHFDCEALFAVDGELYFLTKHRAAGEINGFQPTTALYRLDTRHTDRVNVLTAIGGVRELGVVTGADASPDGERLAVLTYVAVWIFERPAERDDWLSGESRRLAFNPLQTRQIEAVTWIDDDTLFLANENRDLFEARVPRDVSRER